MRKNVLLINNGYPSELYPEYTTYIRDIEECIIASGQSIDKIVITFDHPITPLYKLYKYIRFWIKCLTIRTDCDTIYVNHLPFACPLILNPFIRRKKLIIHWHGNDLASNGIFLRLTRKLLTRFVMKSQNIVPSHYFSNILKSHFGDGLIPVCVSPSGGIDINKFMPVKRNNKYFAIGYASGLRKDKGADLVIYLLNNKVEIERLTRRTIVFHIIKYGVDLDYYQPFLTRLDEKSVKGFDKMAKSSMPDFYNSIDLLVFPSLHESLGLAALEAISCGVPVVAHNVCAFPEFIKPGVSGELVELKDVENEQNRAFLEAVVKAISNIESYTPRMVVETNYSKESVTSFYRNLFETL